MAENGEGLLYKENLRMRGFYRAFYTLMFLFFSSVSFTMLSLPGGLFKTLLSLSIFLPAFGFPAFKFLIARINVEITTDGLHVNTNFPSRQKRKLLGWEQLTSCELTYWPRWGLLGDSTGGLFSKDWSCGSYISKMMSPYGYYQLFKPLFGEREVCFTVRKNRETRIVVLNTNNAFDFVQAIEQAMRMFRNESFSVIIEDKTSFKERFSTQLIIGCLLLVCGIGIIVWYNL